MIGTLSSRTSFQNHTLYVFLLLFYHSHLMVSGWPFLLRSTKVFNKSIPSEAEITENDVLRVALHKPLTVLTLNPLVTRSEVLDPTSKPNLYTTHEDIKLLGIKSDIVSTADCTLTDDGISLALGRC
ncbi:hypothetical protein BDP27DRAFT_1326005 [Rhodocollybia butyracea]|uniref:Uncharacterized protein n=1 Tax=Rhodocollybia butyracea TaxID=206335 RepID=A0A9P5U7Q8_9AGAR|nr:hypothetical protein BDP27DRAFT_1326005 [Rhodocollybia butyracea]